MQSLRYTKIRGVVFDRDGTLIEHVPYLSDCRLVTLLPGVKDGLARLVEQGVLLFLHTNQSGVGRKLFTLQDAIQCNQRMIDLLGLGNGIFESVCIACEAPDEMAVYRKPEPKFAIELMKKYDLHPQELCYVGDRASDLETAMRAGTEAVGVATGLNDLEAELEQAGFAGKFPVVGSFTQVVEYVLGFRGAAGCGE